MKRALGVIWLGSLVTIAVGWFIISSIDERLAMDIAKSFWNGEASIGFWMKHGTPFLWAVGIGIFCSTYDIFNWFCLFLALKTVYPKNIKPIYDKIYGDGMSSGITETPWLRKAHRIGEWIYRFCVPQPDRVHDETDAENTAIATKLRYYPPLIFYGICPGSIFMGVSYTIAFRLNTLAAFLILACANAAKIILFGYLALIMNVWVIVAIVFATPIMRKQIEKYLRNGELATFAETPDLEPED